MNTRIILHDIYVKFDFGAKEVAGKVAFDYIGLEETKIDHLSGTNKMGTFPVTFLCLEDCSDKECHHILASKICVISKEEYLKIYKKEQ